MSTRRILAFTGIRSDYDLLSDLYRKINQDANMELAMIVSGAHLSTSYGYTVQHIERDRLPILARIYSLLDSDSPSSRLKSSAILLQNCMHNVEAYVPDIIIYPGDREDAMVGALIGAYLKIPTIHFFGGDHASDGNVDNPVRHAVSKLSSLHFVIHKSHKERLIKMGEPENRIFVIGNPALDKFVNIPFVEKKILLNQLGCSSWNNYAMMIYHPILEQEDKAGEHFEEILAALKKQSINTFISYPNIDAGNKKIMAVIEKYKKDESFYFYKNLERTIFINLMRQSLFLIGNSSTGLLEAPIIPLGAINVGTRQRGRLAAENVVFVEQDLDEIMKGIIAVLSKEFKDNLVNVRSPYGHGDSAEKAFRLIKTMDFSCYRYKCEDPIL